MQKLLATAAAVLLAASFTATAASAKKLHRGYKAHHSAYGMMRSSSPFRGNAAMSGNNGNSASGSNSLGHIQGGNIGGGK